jgi:hypothetical protein
VRGHWRAGWCALLVSAGAIAIAGALSCNGVLGIGPATVEVVDGDAGAGADGGPEPISCDHYCSVIMNNCTGSNSEYLSLDICMSMCPFFDLGMAIADTTDDTLACRIFNADLAATSPDVACRYAGPLGGGHCGASVCPSFCGLDLTYCVPPRPVAYDAGDPECESDCAGYVYLVTDAGDTTTEVGNTLNCRLWHLETAYTSPAYGIFHCPHTGKDSTTCL